MQWLWQFDQTAFRAIHVGLHRSWLDPVFWVLSSSGLGYVQMIVVLALPILFSRRLHDWRRATPRDSLRMLLRAAVARWSDPGYLVGPLIFTFVLSGGIMSGVMAKMIIERERPSNFAYALPQETAFAHSFPSGHTTTSFAIAFTLLLAGWGTKKVWTGWVALLWACLVGFSRIYRGVHWPTDVLAGLLAGLFSACVTYLVLRKAAEAFGIDEEAEA